jgi:hypothetical protein
LNGASARGRGRPFRFAGGSCCGIAAANPQHDENHLLDGVKRKLLKNNVILPGAQAIGLIGCFLQHG